jgi:hypothetical protein
LLNFYNSLDSFILFNLFSGFGYREVPETYEAQKKMFTNYCNKDSNESTKKAKADEKIQEIITLIQFANGIIIYFFEE